MYTVAKLLLYLKSDATSKLIYYLGVFSVYTIAQ